MTFCPECLLVRVMAQRPRETLSGFTADPGGCGLQRKTAFETVSSVCGNQPLLRGIRHLPFSQNASSTGRAPLSQQRHPGRNEALTPKMIRFFPKQKSLPQCTR